MGGFEKKMRTREATNGRERNIEGRERERKGAKEG